MAVETGVEIYALPEDCIANALSLTSPKDAARLSAVASSFRSASLSDAVWERFLPSDHRKIFSRAVGGPDSLLSKSKKDLYLHLCEHPVLIDGGLKSFSLDKLTGKKCFMISSRDLHIVWSDTPQYWQWISVPESRFVDVVELIDVCWLEIRGKISTTLLSPGTKYAAYLIFNTNDRLYGFHHQPTEAFLGFSGHETEKRNVWLDPEGEHMPRVGLFYHQLVDLLRPQEDDVPHEDDVQSEEDVPREDDVQYEDDVPHEDDVVQFEDDVHHEDDDVVSDEITTAKKPRQRGDGWMEVELGECFVEDGEKGDLEVSLMEIRGGNWKSGITIEGIEIRPKE